MKTIFIIMDSLNKHYLQAYNQESWINTPNIKKLADKGVTFDKHYCGSMPCMPARREMMTGRLNFLETPWGPIEPWDDCLPVELRKQKDTYSHMITDHYHYFHSGGEAYHTLFDTWEFERGQEGDAWHPMVNDPDIPKYRGKNRRQDWVNREYMDSEKDEDYPTPRCFMRAMDFLENNYQEDNWHLHLEVFDPHEPFMCPSKYREMYEDKWENSYHFDWPNYAPVAEEEGMEAIEHIRKSYAGVLTMADHWLGKMFDRMDELGVWEDTVVVLTTDHGHLLGEHGYWAKNYMFDYQQLANIPLIIYTPEMSDLNYKSKIGENGRITAMTATMDIMPTIMEFHNATLPKGVHGLPLQHLLEEDSEELEHHDAVLFGYFAKDINMVNGKYSYCRQPLEDSYLYHHTAMPRGFADFIQRDKLEGAEMGVFLQHCHNVPHYRIKSKSNYHHNAPDFNLIYDIEKDPGQTKPIRDDQLETDLAEKMKELLKRYDAPEIQFERMGL